MKNRVLELLAVLMVLCCLAACGKKTVDQKAETAPSIAQDETKPSENDKVDVPPELPGEPEDTDDSQDTDVPPVGVAPGYEYAGLRLDIIEEMEDLGDGSFVSKDGKLHLTIERWDPDYIQELAEYAETEISSGRTLGQAYRKLCQSQGMEIRDECLACEVYYFYGVGEDGITAISFYFTAGYGWAVTVTMPDETYLERAVEHATCGMVIAVPW